MPVLGRNEEPVFFDPVTLEEMAKIVGTESGAGERDAIALRGPDGTRIVAEGGQLGGFDLRRWCSINENIEDQRV